MSQSQWNDYPMGPQLRAFLRILPEDYRGDKAPRPDEDAVQSFAAYLVELFQTEKPADEKQFVELLDELTNMGLSGAAVQLADQNAHFPIDTDFRGCLALGSALMMESEFDEAILLLRQAMALNPKELAPYINLTAIYFALEQDQEALAWADKGLGIDANHSRLWEIIASIYLYEDKSTAAQRVRSKAEAINSYAGLSLAAEMMDGNDRLLKAQLLEDAFNAGSRDDDFLIEYTASLGLAQQFEKIPQIIWRLEQMEKKAVHWKLYAHAAQAYLAMNKEEEASEMIRKASKSPQIPPQVIEDLQRIYEQERPAP